MFFSISPFLTSEPIMERQSLKISFLNSGSSAKTVIRPEKEMPKELSCLKGAEHTSFQETTV